MGAVTIGANTYDIYGTSAAATIYLAARIGSTAWTSATADTRSQALVTGTRQIQAYLLSRGFDVDPAGAVDAAIENANYELAYLLVVNPALQDVASASNNRRRVKAGSAEVEYFRPEAGGRFPSVVQTLLTGWLAEQAGGSTYSSGYASGTCEDSTLIRNRSQIETGCSE